MQDKNFKPTAPFISGQLPEFVRIDHPTLVSFLTAYYEWLDSDNKYLRSPKKLASVIDVDTTLDEFINYFKNEYLLGFPEKLAMSEKTGKPVDPVKLMKNIKGFYRAKGTEKTYDFLFRVLFDTSVEFYYPKNDIMKLSDGKWVVRRSIKTSNGLGNNIFDAVGKTIVQKNTNNEILASARVIEASTYRVGTNDITELFLGGVNGQFKAGYDGIEFTDSDGNIRKENRIFSVIGKITITNSGTGYKAGDKVVFTTASGDTGVKAAARVAEVDANGAVRKILIDNYGINYKVPPSIKIESESGTGFLATVSVSGIAEYQGYYANNDGRLSTNKVIQDSHYYQNFSYVILSEVTIDRYRDVLKRLLNPAGLAFFGKVQIKRCAVADLQNSTSLVEYEVPIIGHYTPYTFLTNDDLSNWFSDPNTGLLAGYDPTVHNSIIRNDIDSSGAIDAGDIGSALILGLSPIEYYKSIGNPVTFNRAFQNPLVPIFTKNFQNADPFWIIYQHPNRKIRGSVTARIPFDLKNEFLNDMGGLNELAFDLSPNNSGETGYWAEWTEGNTGNRLDWAKGFTSGERYVTLNYNPLIPFTQTYQEPQTQPLSGTLKQRSSTGKYLPLIFIDSVHTYDGNQRLESITTKSGKSAQVPYKESESNDSYTQYLPDFTQSPTGSEVTFIGNVKTQNLPNLNEYWLNNTDNDTGQQNVAYKTSEGSQKSSSPIARKSSFTNWDSTTSTHYLTTPTTAYLGVSGLTNTSFAAMDKFVRSLSGDIAADWNGISGAGGYRLGDTRYFNDFDGLIAMNTESWDYLLGESNGVPDQDNPNSKLNFVLNKVLIPMFTGGIGADGKSFAGLRQIYPNAKFGNYGHPQPPSRWARSYSKYPGFDPTARTSKSENLTVGGITYKSYVPSLTCPDCRWDGRDTLDSNDPNAAKAPTSHWLDLSVSDRNYHIKIWKEKWYNYCKNVQVWMPSFYIATEDLEKERAEQWLTIECLIELRRDIVEELGYDDKFIIPFISNKYYTVFTGSGGFSPNYKRSIQDSSFLTPKEFVDNYIKPSLSGHAEGTVQGFYIWTGDDTYTVKQTLSITTPNPLKLDVTDSNGNVIGWKLNPKTCAYGFEPYWDFNGGESLRPAAPTGPGVIGKNGKPRVAWYVQGGGYGHNPWWGGNRAPSWPTSQNPASGEGCQRLEVNSTLYHMRQNILAYQAYFDGTTDLNSPIGPTGQTDAQFQFDKPEKYGYLKTKYPSFFQKGTNLPEWSRTKGYVYHVRKFSADGNNTLDLSMAAGTTFAFNYRSEIKINPNNTSQTITRPVRQRDGMTVTGHIISNPLFNSLTGSSTTFSYPDGTSYKDRGWNTADRIGYVKSVRSLDANTAEIVVEPFFFVGQPVFTQDSNNDQTIWSGIPNPSNLSWQQQYLPDGITCGITSGNGVSNIGITGPHGTHGDMVTSGFTVDPNWTSMRPKYVNLGFAGDIIRFGSPTGPTFELSATTYVTGDYQRISGKEIDSVLSLVDEINTSQIQACVDYWDQLYNPERTTDFSFEYNSTSDKWFVYGPGDRIIVNGWSPNKSGGSNCSSGSISPTITVTTDDNTGEMIINYSYENLCSEPKYAEWPDTPSLNLGDSIDYYDTSVYGSTGTGVGVYKTLDRNHPVKSSRYPDVLYSPVHLAKTKFSGNCCVDNNFAVSMSMLDLFPESYDNDIGLVVYPPQDSPSVVLAGTQIDIVSDVDFYSKITPTEKTDTSKWAAAWDPPKIGGATGTTHITTMFKVVPGRVSGNAFFDAAITGATSAKLFLSTIPPERRAIQTFFLNGAFADEYWRSVGITLDNTYNTGDACRNSAGNFVTADVNDTREVVGKTGAYDGTQRFISPWFDNSAARAKQIFTTWLSEFSSIGGSAQYFIGDNEDNPASIWSNYLRTNTADTTTRKVTDHLNTILADPRANSLTAGNAATYGSFRSQLQFGTGYTTSQFSNIGLNDLRVDGVGATAGAYKLWNSVVSGLVTHYLNDLFVSPITSYYPNAKISNYDNGRVTQTDNVTDLNGHREYFNKNLGTAVAPYLYGEIGGVSNGYFTVYTGDTTTITFASATSAQAFKNTPFNSLLLSQQKLRAYDRNRITDGKELQIWIASRKYYGFGLNAFGGNVPFHNEYWRENVYHSLMHNPELLLYWNSSSVTPEDDQYMHNAIDVVNNITGQKILNTLSMSNEKLNYNSEFLVSGCVSSNRNKNVFRVSVDRSLVNSIDVYGTKYDLAPLEVGLWLITEGNATAIQKISYDNATKTLFLKANTNPQSSRYKAYTDRYSFQFATIAESSLYSPNDTAAIYSQRNGDSRDSVWLNSRYTYVSGAS